MEYVTVGRTGVKVSRLCFGTMSFGGDADEATSGLMFKNCRDAGINFFDTANVYSRGKSEEILGRLIKGTRDELVLTTKVAGRMGDGPNDGGLSRRAINLQIDASLKRLQTDRVEFYFLHAFDAETPVEETLGALNDLVRAGKILYPAVSNWAAWQIEQALGISARRQWARFELLQPMYSLVKRQAEVEIFPMAQAERLGVIPYSPLGGGLLTGKYAGGKKPEVGRINDNAMYAKRFAAPWVHEAAGKLAERAQARNVHPATLAVAWVMAHPAVTAPIIGARNPEQLAPSLKAADLKLTREERAEISALTPRPPIATDRTEEQQPE